MCDQTEKSAHLSRDDHMRAKVLCIKGKIFSKKSNETGCIEAFEEALELKKKLLGNNHSDVSTILTVFATALIEVDLFQQSVDYFLEAYRI